MTKQLSLRERWALDGEMLTEAPYTLDAQPRWITDDLADVYGPDADAQPGIDELPEDDEEADEAGRAADPEALHHWWTRGEGLAKWASSPHPWTALYKHLRKYVGSARAKRMAAEWHHEVLGIWPGEKRGQNPVGPG